MTGVIPLTGVMGHPGGPEGPGLSGPPGGTGVSGGVGILDRTGPADRTYWVALLEKIATPVLHNMSQGTLRKNMPVEYSPLWGGRDKSFAYLEALGRLMAGVAPWLSLPDDDTAEGKVRGRLREEALQSMVHCVDPASPDYVNWNPEGQQLVDAAFLAHAFIRAPAALWQPLDRVTRERFITVFRRLRDTLPSYNNWLMFAAIVEAFLLSIDEWYDPMRIDLALHKMNEWYVGDGWYSDGPHFHFDYYNGYVIQPMMTDILKVMLQKGKTGKAAYDLSVRRMQRYSEFLERFISPEGTYPPFGRSITYRVGVFQPVGQLALNEQLPEELSPAQVRSAMTAVMKRMFEQPGVFTDSGWLQLGFAGHQPSVADYYSDSGSMYLTSLGFLPLGLPADHAFWTDPYADWTQRKAWSGQPFKKDYAVNY
jgi:hypothetical protein